jgi:hypothetical protein
MARNKGIKQKKTLTLEQIDELREFSIFTEDSLLPFLKKHSLSFTSFKRRATVAGLKTPFGYSYSEYQNNPEKISKTKQSTLQAKSTNHAEKKQQNITTEKHRAKIKETTNKRTPPQSKQHTQKQIQPSKQNKNSKQRQPPKIKRDNSDQKSNQQKLNKNIKEQSATKTKTNRQKRTQT